MADYRDLAGEFERAGFGIAALSVDPPERSAKLRESLRLPYMLLCDPGREVVRAWGLLNRFEMNVSLDATFVLGGDRRVLIAQVEAMYARLKSARVLELVKQGLSSRGTRASRSLVLPSVKDWLRAPFNGLRHGFFTRTPR